VTELTAVEAEAVDEADKLTAEVVGFVPHPDVMPIDAIIIVTNGRLYFLFMLFSFISPLMLMEALNYVKCISQKGTNNNKNAKIIISASLI
jgi:hypothetical protein